MPRKKRSFNSDHYFEGEASFELVLATFFKKLHENRDL